ncbi:MAG: hypothetical protein AAFV53_36980 [Myxococcota bacterium]
MINNRIFRFTAFTLLSGLLAFSMGSDDAMAGKKKRGNDAPTEIVETGISAFDDTFMQVKTIHGTLDTSETSIKTAETDMLTAVGAATDAPLETALADFQSQAQEFITVEMDGTMPSLNFKPEAPANVQTGVNGINSALGNLKGVIAELETLPDEVSTLIDAATAMPAQVPSAVKDAGLGVKEIRPTTQKVKDNVTVTNQTPARVESTLGAATGLVKTVTDTFTAQ